MRIFLLFLFMVSIAGKPFPVRHMHTELMRKNRLRVPLKNFTPQDLSKSSRKYLPPLGGSGEWGSDADLDNLAVEMRIHALENVTAQYQKFQLHKLLSEAFVSPVDSLHNYMEYHLGTMFLEVGVLEILFRFIYGKLTVDERGILTVHDFIEYSKNFMKSRYNYEIDYLTPRMVMDWIYLMLEPSSLRVEYDLRSIKNPSPTSLVKLEMASWHTALSARLNRLRLTGYENIDL